MRCALVMLSLLAAEASLVAASEDDSSLCPSSDVTVAGSAAVINLVQQWAARHNTTCEGRSTISVLGPEGTSASGARQVCNDTSEQAVMVGAMSRPWNVPQESTNTDTPFIFECAAHQNATSARRTFQLSVAMDALILGVATNSTAHRCIAAIGGGLTIDQIRWIYSGLTEAELVASGTWNASSIISDGDDATHHWSELNSGPDCPATEIKISGARADSDNHEFFKSALFHNSSEEHPLSGRTLPDATVLNYVTAENETALLQFLDDNPDGISYFGLSALSQNATDVFAVPIHSGQTYVQATASAISSGAYVPLSRHLYLNVLDDNTTLARVRPFLAHAFSNEGTTIVNNVGLVPLPVHEQQVMLARIGAPGPPSLDLVECGSDNDSGGSYTIAGSSTVRPVADLWSEIFMVKCHQYNISVFGGGSSRGASRVCNVDGDNLTAVQIGAMSREWKTSEATTNNGYEYTCQDGGGESVPRKAIQIDVAIDGLTVAFRRGGIADRCINSLQDKGLTIEQLRWIFSSRMVEPTNGGISAALPNSDSNPDTHLWSELGFDPLKCPETEILIAGADELSGTHDYFAEVIFPDRDQGETFASNRPGVQYFSSEHDEDIVRYLVDNDGAIGYFGYAYFTQNDEQLVAAAIKNDEGVFVTPSASTVQGGSYNPLSRRIYMNLLDEPYALTLTRPLVEMGLSAGVGAQLIEKFTGYSPIPERERIIMRSRAGTASSIQVQNSSLCGETDQDATRVIRIRGSSTVRPVADSWGGVYEIGCDNVDVQVHGGGSSVGADTVCGGPPEATDIGDMSRQWKSTEARRLGTYGFECAEHDTSRSVAQFEVAIDGLAVVTANTGAAKECIDRLGGGLTINQLRWIFSSYTEGELVRDGWPLDTLQNSDFDPFTHRWSELHPDCTSDEIHIAGADQLSGTFEYFSETVFASHEDGETFDTSRPGGYFNADQDELIIEKVLEDTHSIAYFGYSYFFLNRDRLNAASVQNPETGAFVAPNNGTVADGSYKPLARTIYMNVWMEEFSLTKTLPFLRFGYTQEGSALVAATGYVPLPETQIDEMLSRIQQLESGDYSGGKDSSVDGAGGVDGGESSGLSFGAILGVVFGGAVVLLVVMGGIVFAASRAPPSSLNDTKDASQTVTESTSKAQLPMFVGEATGEDETKREELPA